MKAKDEMLVKSERLFRVFIDASQDMIFLKDDHFRHVFANRALCNYYGRDSEDVIGRLDFDLMTRSNANACRASDKRAVVENVEYVSEEIAKGRVFESVKFPVTLPDGRVGVGGILRDITERKKSESHLIYLGYHDHLTGLHNRRYFEEETERLDIEAHLPLSVVVVDINGVKFVNDAFGRAAGDRMIVTTAHGIQTCCRRNDVLARTGGDEFMLLLPSTDAEAARHVMERIQAAILKPRLTSADESDSEGVSISIAMGCCTKSLPEESFADVMKSAEDDMFQSKLLDRKSSHNRLISSIRATMVEKSQETEAHSERLIDLSHRMGEILQLTAKELRELELLSVLHDIGKVGIPEKILNKPAKLDEEEWIIMRKHSEMGYRIAMASPELVSIADLILTHHEHWDGKGYPQGLVGNATPLLSRILAVVDAYDAMASDRPYRKSMPKDRILEELQRNVGTQFDPTLVTLFLERVLPAIP
jgi:diguanylate cyclase (GGDEF)-like protein/PAS domain S-box-containing protein